MVEGGGLENRKARKGLGGSNPSSSANSQQGPRKAVNCETHNRKDSLCNSENGLPDSGPNPASALNLHFPEAFKESKIDLDE